MDNILAIVDDYLRAEGLPVDYGDIFTQYRLCGVDDVSLQFLLELITSQMLELSFSMSAINFIGSRYG